MGIIASCRRGIDGRVPIPAETGRRAGVPHASAAVAATVTHMDLAKFDIICGLCAKITR